MPEGLRRGKGIEPHVEILGGKSGVHQGFEKDGGESIVKNAEYSLPAWEEMYKMCCKDEDKARTGQPTRLRLSNWW